MNTKKNVFKMVALVLVLSTFFMLSSISVFATNGGSQNQECQTCMVKEAQDLVKIVELVEDTIDEEYTSKGITNVKYEIHQKATEEKQCNCEYNGIEPFYIPCPGPSGHSYYSDKVIYLHVPDSFGLCDLYLRNIYECRYCDHSYMAPEFYAGMHTVGSAGCPF